MRFKNILLLYKKSAYKIYVLENKIFHNKLKGSLFSKELERFKLAHDEHYNNLHKVKQILSEKGLNYSESYRGKVLDYSTYDLIITVGGDGTFLEASRHLKDQLIVGVNSAPSYSVGRFCTANLQNFSSLLDKIISGNYPKIQYHRLKLVVNKKEFEYFSLNDLLVCHKNPAVLCRYYLKIGNQKEEQRSSGIWISTPAGSTGATRSAGGEILNPTSKVFQYKPRELYSSFPRKYRFQGGILKADQTLIVTSLMREGMIYLDGAHVKIPFDFGSELRVQITGRPITTVKYI